MDSAQSVRSHKFTLFHILKCTVVWGLLYLGLVTGVVFYVYRNYAYDDPFITYRYAENLQRGFGFVYNPGEQVLSTTTPLFTLLLALLGTLTLWPDLPHLANLIGSFSLGLGGLFLWDLARSWDIPIAGLAGLLIFPTFPLLLTTLGSEVPMYLALCLGAFAFYARQRYVLAAVFSALAILARPDGALVPLLLTIGYLLRDQRPIPWIAVVVFLGLTLPWFLFAWSYFGSPLPATLLTKQHQGSLPVSQRFAPGLLTIINVFTKGWQYWLEAVLALIGLIFTFWRARRWVLFFSWPGLYFLSYTILAVSRYFWYYAPLVPGLVAAVGLGITALVSTAWPAKGKRIPLNLGVILLITLLIGQVSDLWKANQFFDRRPPIYQAIGEWLNANTFPDSKVGALEVGIIGYYARRPMVDFAGLIQPEVAQQLTPQSSYEDAALWAVENYHPEYLVLHEGNFPRLEQNFNEQSCTHIRQFNGSKYGYSKNLNIYHCLQ